MQYFKIPPSTLNISDGFRDTHNKFFGSEQSKSVYLQKDTFVPAYLELARTMKDDFVYGKPKLDLYYLGLKPEQVNQEFGGKHQPLKVINKF